MSRECRAVVVDEIRRRGPLTVAEYMDLALYHPACGYYTTVARRSGRDRDFFTSVDVGRVFGELLAVQLGGMWRILKGANGAERAKGAEMQSALAPLAPSAPPAPLAPSAPSAPPAPLVPFDLVEAGAGNGQLAADILEASSAQDPEFYDAIKLSLVEPSAAARSDQPATLGRHHPKLVETGETLPSRIDGIIYANELLDALPTHVVVMREDGLREIYVDLEGDRLVEREAEPSTPALERYLRQLNLRLAPGWRTEINLRAAAWVVEAARKLHRGFLLLIDYGHEAAELYSATHSRGTLSTFHRHVLQGERRLGAIPSWLEDPGSRDIASHVDLTSVRLAAEGEGLETIGILDQTYFLIGLGAAERLAQYAGEGRHQVKSRLALKTLITPGGLGSVQKVMMFARGVGRPSLRGCSYKMRVT